MPSSWLPFRVVNHEMTGTTSGSVQRSLKVLKGYDWLVFDWAHLWEPNPMEILGKSL